VTDRDFVEVEGAVRFLLSRPSILIAVLKGAAGGDFLGELVRLARVLSPCLRGYGEAPDLAALGFQEEAIVQERHRGN
jgi:hypothetical protein